MVRESRTGCRQIWFVIVDTMGDSARERERSAEPRAPEFKTFVGGISWQTTDQELSDSECRSKSIPVIVMTALSIVLMQYDSVRWSLCPTWELILQSWTTCTWSTCCTDGPIFMNQ